MKILTIILIMIIMSFSIFYSSGVFAQGLTYNTALEKQFGNTTKTILVHDNAILILNQTVPKLTYGMGENITVNTELTNIGDKTVTIGYCEPWVAFEIKNQAGDEMWPKSQLACIPEFTGKITLQPGEHVSVQPWSSVTAHTVIPSPRLDIPGNYDILSIAVFTFNTDSKSLGPLEILWSKPLQITILQDQYVQNETNSSASKISYNQTAVQVAEPTANQECIGKIMAQEHTQDVPIDNVRALDLATNYTLYKTKTLGHNYTLNRIYHDFSIDSCTARIKDVIVEFVEKNSLGHSLITITEDLELDRVKTMDISQINDEPVTRVDAYMTPNGPQIDNGLILFIMLAIGSISVVSFFIFRMRFGK